MYQIGRSQQLVTELRRASRVPMEKLAQSTGQSCHLSIQEAGELLVVLERMPAKCLCLSVGEGSTFPIWRTASGKVLIGGMSVDERDMLLEQDDAYNELPSGFQERVCVLADASKSNGYLAQSSDMTEGVFDIAVPVGLAGEEGMVLALSCLDSSMSEESKDDRLLNAVLECAQQINNNLGLTVEVSGD
jgi:DNA-binding IclR family transcriptional regulator